MMVEVLIWECLREGNTLSIIGTINHGVVKVGSVFTSLSPNSRIGNDAIGRAVNLKVVRISAFHRDLDELEKGMCGKFVLEGEGAATLPIDEFLSHA